MACASKSRFPQQCAQYMSDYYYHHYYYYRIKLQPHGAADLQYVCRGAVTQYNTYYKCSLLGFAQQVCSFQFSSTMLYHPPSHLESHVKTYASLHQLSFNACTTRHSKVVMRDISIKIQHHMTRTHYLLG